MELPSARKLEEIDMVLRAGITVADAGDKQTPPVFAFV